MTYSLSNHSRVGCTLLIMLLLCSCFGRYESEKDFIKKYGNENFDIFINTSFLIRGTDEEGDPIIFANMNFKNAYYEGPYIMTIEKETGSIKNSSFKLMNDSLNFNKKGAHDLALRFLKYRIYSIAVDENRNVYIRLKYGERPALVRFSDSDFISEEYEKQWKNLGGNWYAKQK